MRLVNSLIIALAGLIVVPAATLGVEYLTPTNQSAVVSMFLNAASRALPVSLTNPLPVGAANLAYSVSGSSSIGTTSATLITAGQYTQAVKLCTKLSDTANVWLNLAGGTAVANSGLPIWGGGQCRTIGTTETPMPTSAVTAITDGGATQVLLVTGG